MKSTKTVKAKAVMAAPSQYKYKGRWGVLKRAKSIFVEFIAGDESLYIDLVMAFEPDQVEPFLNSLAEKHSLVIKEELEEGTYLALRNDSTARECVRYFEKHFLPDFTGTDHEKHFSYKEFFCGDLPEEEMHKNGHKPPWDDSVETHSQTKALNDGRVIKIVAWSESDESYVDFEVSAEDLPEMDIDQILAYLSDQGFDTLCKVDKSKLALGRKGTYQQSISKTASTDWPDYVITWTR